MVNLTMNTPEHIELADEPAAEPMDVEGLARKFQKELNAGLIALVLLSVLDRASEDLYGYQIAKSLTAMNLAGAPMKQGAPLSGAPDAVGARPAGEPRGALGRRTAAPLLPHHARRPRDARALALDLDDDPHVRRRGGEPRHFHHHRQ